MKQPHRVSPGKDQRRPGEDAEYADHAAGGGAFLQRRSRSAGPSTMPVSRSAASGAVEAEREGGERQAIGQDRQRAGDRPGCHCARARRTSSPRDSTPNIADHDRAHLDEHPDDIAVRPRCRHARRSRRPRYRRRCNGRGVRDQPSAARSRMAAVDHHEHRRTDQRDRRAIWPVVAASPSRPIVTPRGNPAARDCAAPDRPPTGRRPWYARTSE